jgi:hypothetical protein
MKNLAASAVLGLVAVPPAGHTCSTVRDRGWSHDGDNIPVVAKRTGRCAHLVLAVFLVLVASLSAQLMRMVWPAVAQYAARSHP